MTPAGCQARPSDGWAAGLAGRADRRAAEAESCKETSRSAVWQSTFTNLSVVQSEGAGCGTKQCRRRRLKQSFSFYNKHFFPQQAV